MSRPKMRCGVLERLRNISLRAERLGCALHLGLLPTRMPGYSSIRRMPLYRLGLATGREARLKRQRAAWHDRSRNAECAVHVRLAAYRGGASCLEKPTQRP